MKKRVIFGISSLFVLGCLFIWLGLDKTHWLQNKDHLYSKAINHLIEYEKKHSIYIQKQDYQVFTDYYTFGIEEKDNQIYVYMWVLLESYYVEDNHLTLANGYSLFHKLTFEDNQILTYEVPKDDQSFRTSIKNMCPKSIENKVAIFLEENLSVERQVKQHYSYLPSTKVSYGSVNK